MSLFSKFNRSISFQEYADSYGLTRAGLNAEICRITRERLQAGDLVFVLPQFPSTFLQIQAAFDQRDVDYRVQATPLDENQLEELISENHGREAILTLAEMLQKFPVAKLPYSSKISASVIVTERHPLGAKDESISAAARRLPLPTRLGFFLALDDPLLKPVNGDWVGSLLRTLGATETELISSHMVSKRIRSLQRRIQATAKSDKPADSADHWMAINTTFKK